MTTTYSLTLFVSPETAGDATIRMRELLKGMRSDTYTLETVDVSQEPLKAQRWKITDVPALLILRSGPGKGLPEKVLTLEDAYPIRYSLGLASLW